MASRPRYRQVAPRIWHDEKFSQLDPTAKLVFMYLITGPQTNRIGIFTMSCAAGAENCGITQESFRKAFDSIKESFQFLWHQGSRTLFIPTWWKYQKNDHRNAFVGCLSDLHELPQSPLISEFLSNDRYLSSSQSKALAFERESFAVPKLPGTGTGTGTGTGSKRKKSKKVSEAGSKPDPDPGTRIKFSPPDVSEVREYCRTRQNSVDADQFCDFYSSKGWMVGKSKMKDWRASVRTWERNSQPLGTAARLDDDEDEPIYANGRANFLR